MLTALSRTSGKSVRSLARCTEPAKHCILPAVIWCLLNFRRSRLESGRCSVVRVQTNDIWSYDRPELQSLRYAFISAGDDGNTIAVDLLGFLESVAGTDAALSSMSTRLAEIWDNEMSLLRQDVAKKAKRKSGEEALDTDVIRVCGTQEVEEVLKVMQDYEV